MGVSHESSVALCADGCTCAAGPTAAVDDAGVRRWAWWLTVLTISWNSVEALVAIGSGVLAGSIALVGFGLDSVVEVASALVIVWRLSQQSADAAANERAERRATRLIALTFFAIALYVVYDAGRTLLGLDAEPHPSTLGLTITVLSLVVMPTLAWGKRRVAARLGSAALQADASETQLCTYLSAVVLIGLAANDLVGWWWMDPMAGLVVAALAIKEGRAAWTNAALCRC